MTVANTALLFNLGISGFLVNDDNIAIGATQGTAWRAGGQLTRIIGGVSNAGLVLPSILSGEAAWLTFVINDGLNTYKIYPSTGESMGGTLNASLSIPAGQSGIFVPVFNSKGGTTDWRSAVIP